MSVIVNWDYVKQVFWRKLPKSYEVHGWQRVRRKKFIVYWQASNIMHTEQVRRRTEGGV